MIFLGFSLKKSRFLDKAFIHLNISTFPFFSFLSVFNCNRPYSHTCYFKNYAGNENLINGRHTAQNYKLLCDQTARIWAETLGDDFSEFFSNFTRRGEHNNSTITLVCSSSRIHCSLFCRPHLSSSGSVCTTLTGASSPRGAASTLLFIYTFSRATLASIRSRRLMNLLAFAGSRGRCLSL